MKKEIKNKPLGLIFSIILSLSLTLATTNSVEAKNQTTKTEQITEQQKKRLQKETKQALNDHSIKDDTSKKLDEWDFQKKKNWKVTVKSKKNKKILSEFKWSGKKTEKPQLTKLTVNKKEVLDAEEQKVTEIKKQQKKIEKDLKKSYSYLAHLEYSGEQTIDVNKGKPYFTDKDLTLKQGAWETYGDLDSLNRATVANAMLNQSLMPTEKRGDISKVKPTGWKNKEIKGGYLFNRSHLIGFALSGENDNWKNLITGTRQLNSPEMLRHEMDVKEYLERSKDNYVRYRITPIFKDDELLARGVQMEAQSINSSDITFNVYIFNIQDGVTLDYTDGSSRISKSVIADNKEKKQETQLSSQKPPLSESQEEDINSDEPQYIDENGNGLIKGSNNHIYHIPGSTYYNRTTNPAAWFKTISEAEQAGYRAPKK